ncbi:MAG: hypothetical protein GF364_14015 [Candidatus Lokiarchaeota archaeon]|nr:hypothetical protein [Candidatus Lokiarchaeota archaeon]
MTDDYNRRQSVDKGVCVLSKDGSEKRGIQKPRGSITKGEKPTDVFLNTLWEVLEKEASLIKTQMPRFNKLWTAYFKEFKLNPHQIRKFLPDNKKFFGSNKYKVAILKRLEASLIDAYYTIKDVVLTIFKGYFPNSNKFLSDIDEEDRIPIMFKSAEVLIGSLLQFLSTEKDIISIKYLVIAKNKSMLRLKGRTDQKLLEKLRSSGFESDINTINKIMTEISDLNYVEKRKITEEEQAKGLEGNFFYKWNKEKDFTLSNSADKIYHSRILPVIEWCIGIWRSMYNIRELDVEILDSYKWKAYLEKTVKKAATQGFMTCYWVIKNIRKYYEMLVKDELKG